MTIKKKPKISVIIPAYNEKNTILDIIKQVKKVPLKKEIIIIDDFSKDGTREILRKISDKEVKVLFHDKNYGKGHAIRTGIKGVIGDIVIIQDADLEYDPQDYVKLIKPITEGKSKVVYGTRFPRKKDKFFPFFHYFSLSNPYYLANKILTMTSNILYFANITDEPTCYKVFDAEVFKNINLKCEKFEFCPEVTAKVRKKGYKIFEVPINYYPRSVKEGKKIKLKDAFDAFWTLFKYRFND
ncbi:MAG: glycosyltransferase family 2 protein [archaeon]|nr:glycosyltransferase family 2 protein [archaeon]